MTPTESNRLLLKKQAQLRRQGWSSDDLVRYARGWNNPQFGDTKCQTPKTT